jgi:hypothetical protein
MVVRCLTKQIGIVLVCALALTYGSATSYADQFINMENLKADLQTRDIDRIGKTLNDVKQMKYQGQILPFLVDLWSNQKAKYPELQWEIINSDIVRVDIANVFLQAQRNGRIQINDDELYEFLEKLLGSSDLQVAQNAILTLSLIDEPRSVEKILSAANRKNKWTFRSSFVALTSMCHPAAEKALDQLEVLVKDDRDISVEIQKGRLKMKEYKTRTGICKK